MFQFDEFGYITPPEVHVLTLAEFERIFVFDSGRERLFRRLMDLIEDLKKLSSARFYLWVDGSFVTKKRVPRDIDIVVFFEETFLNVAFQYLIRVRRKFEPDLDIFFASPKTEKRWQEFFTSDRAGRLKGFIQFDF